MNSVPNANDDRRLAQAVAVDTAVPARIAGVLFLGSILAGAFGEAYVPSKLIVSGDATVEVTALE